MIREPVVAGQFYPKDRAALTGMLAQMIVPAPRKRRVAAALLPHAGYVFSGPTAGAVIGAIEVPERVILISTSHHFDYPPCALWRGGAWRTPLGEAPVDEALTDAIARVPGVMADDRAHEPEHSGEVIVPFLQFVQPALSMAFLCVTQSCNYESLKTIGEGLARVVRAADGPVLIVASSDMSHEQGPRAMDVVREHDDIAVRRMEALDGEGLLRECLRRNITMCGVRPAVAAMEAARALGATKGEAVRRATSADSPYGRGDYIVGYAGMIFLQ